MIDNAVLYPLGCGVQIYTNAVHKFGIDAILLASFAAARKSDIACDLGTGCGIIPFLWCRGDAPKSVTAVDIQREAIELVENSVSLNSVGGRITPLCADLKALPAALSNKFTLVTMNPPYKKLTGGAMSPDDARAIARHEVKCKLDDIVKAASKLLKPSGRLVMCHRPERLADLISAMREHGLEPKRLRIVCSRADKAPSLILCEGRKCGASGMVIEPPLIIENEAGGYTDEMKEIYAEFAAKDEV